MLFLDADGGSVNTDSQNEYYRKVLNFRELWNSGHSSFQIQTSGSTGTPKVIELSRQQLIDSANLTKGAFNLQAGDIAFCCLNVDYIAGMMMLVRAFEIGMDLMVVEPKSNPFEGIEKHLYLLRRNAFYAFVPLQIEALLEKEEYFTQLNSAKTIIIGGASVNDTILEKIQTFNSPVYATYGMTETVTHIAKRRLNGIEKQDYFEVLEDVKIELDNRNCLKIYSKTTQNQWVTTNDVVELIDSNKFRIIGRADNIINSGGVKIQLEKVESEIGQILRNLQFNHRFFTYGIDDEQLGQKLILILEKEKPDDDLVEAFKILSKFERPKEVFVVEQFIETPTAKIDKIKTINAYILNQISNG
jgi:o-succinylbenzoate---CoA ligase